MDTTTQKIAGRIKALRLAANYKQEWMAHRLEISQNAYSKIELGKTELTVKRLFELAAVFKVPATKILDL